MSALDFDTVTIDGVWRAFGRRWALSGVDLTLESGELFGLLGPNGAGKSTLLSVLSTLLAPTRGEVRYGQRTAAELGAPLRGRIGVLAHDLYLYDELSAAQNLEFFARLYDAPSPAARAKTALERAGLADRADDAVGQFSRGMRQRLALERALLHDPRLVLLDEPFTGLDEPSSHALIARLRELRDAGCIIVAATHDLDAADALFDRAAVLTTGRLQILDAARGGVAERYRAFLRGARSSAADARGAPRPGAAAS